MKTRYERARKLVGKSGGREKYEDFISILGGKNKRTGPGNSRDGYDGVCGHKLHDRLKIESLEGLFFIVTTNRQDQGTSVDAINLLASQKSEGDRSILVTTNS